MLSLAGGEIESFDFARGKISWKIDIEAETGREQQARQQRKVAGNRVDTALSEFCRRDGKERSATSLSRGSVNFNRGQKHRYGSCFFSNVCVRLNSPGGNRPWSARSASLSQSSAR